MNKNIFQILLTIVFAGSVFTGCKKWDDHNALTDPMVGKDLFQQISENGDLSKFAELLTKSGYDKIIASSKTYTVFAPINAALATLDPAIVANDSTLRLFVGNHITNQLYETTAGTGQRRLQMLSGKYNNLQANKLEDATITTANKYAKNGFVHIIDKVVPPLQNAWQFLETSPLAPIRQKDFMLSLFHNVFDSARAEQIGVDPITGEPVYRPGTDSVLTNLFWHNVYDLRDESMQFTVFVLSDAALDTEVNKYKPFFVTGSADSTTSLATYEVIKDMAVEGVYQAGSIPDTILSKFNVKVGIDESKIVQSVKVSNGIIHIMSMVEVKPVHKFQQYVIQAEHYDFTSNDRRGNTWFRNKMNPLTSQQFKDVIVYQHGVAQFYLGYRLSNVPALKYKAYWVALNDNINGVTGIFKQKVGIGTFNSNLLPYVNVAPNDYREIYLGEFTLSRYSPVMNIHLTADNTTNNSLNLITADYIRLEPVL